MTIIPQLNTVFILCGCCVVLQSANKNLSTKVAYISKHHTLFSEPHWWCSYHRRWNDHHVGSVLFMVEIKKYEDQVISSGVNFLLSFLKNLSVDSEITSWRINNSSLFP
jgi:hypothetical protein